MDKKAMFEKINSIHEKTGKSKLYLLYDMQRCARKYGAGYMDYDLFEMYNLTPEQRDTYITRGRNNEIDKKKNLYETHPQTGAKIKGFKFPDWDKAIAMCKEAAKVVPQMGYIGWDVCFTPDGPVFVEGNEFPGHDIYQLPEHTPDKLGMMPKFNI